MKRLALLACLALACSATLGQELKMHRKLAGEQPDAAGWMLAKSTDGRFSVKLPLKFNDFSVIEVDPKAPVARTHTVGTRSTERITLQVQYRKGATSAKEFFANFEKGQNIGGKPESVTPRKAGAQRAVDVVMRRSKDVAFQRIVLLDTDLLMLTVDAPAEHEALARQLAATFFDSLQFDPK